MFAHVVRQKYNNALKFLYKELKRTKRVKSYSGEIENIDIPWGNDFSVAAKIEHMFTIDTIFFELLFGDTCIFYGFFLLGMLVVLVSIFLCSIYST